MSRNKVIDNKNKSESGHKKAKKDLAEDLDSDGAAEAAADAGHQNREIGKAKLESGPRRRRELKPKDE